MSLVWFVLLFVGLWPAGCFAADDGEDYLNNLVSDLAPLLTLLGERITTQFLSQSTGLADCIVLAMAPVGVVTIIVSAVRVGGPTWLKAIIGRARENISTAEIELMSSTSRETCELWNGRNVVRCQGSGQIWQFICLFPGSWNDGDVNCPNPEVEVKTLRDALDSGRAGVYVAAVVGMVLQIAVLLYPWLITRHSRYKDTFTKDDEPVDPPALLFFTFGTLGLVVGMFLCARIVDRSTEETHYEASNGDKLRIVWLQKNNTVNDQVTKDKWSEGFAISQTESLTAIGVLTSVAGFFVQFTGFRSMNWSASGLQLAAILVMAFVRAVVRLRFAWPPSSTCLTPGFELDWLAVNLAHLAESPWSKGYLSQDRTSKRTPAEEAMIPWAVAGGYEERDPTLQGFGAARPDIGNDTTVQRVMAIRKVLGNLADWRGPASAEAVRLSGALEAAMDALLPPPSVASPGSYVWGIPICHESDVRQISIGLTWRNGAWAIHAREVEAILSLWLYSARWGQRKPADIENQRLDEGDSRLRAEGEREPGLKLFGSSARKNELIRDLQWWVPEGAPGILQVEEVNKETDSRGRAHQGYWADIDVDLDVRTDEEIQNAETILAVRSYDPLEKLYSKDLFLRFIRAVVGLPNVAITSPSKIVNSQGQGDQSWRHVKLCNEELSELALKIEETRFGSLSEIYFHLVSALSLERKLPDTVVAQTLERRAQTDQLAQEDSNAGYALKQLCGLARASDPYYSSLNPRAVVLCLESLRRRNMAKARFLSEGMVHGLHDLSRFSQRLVAILQKGFHGGDFVEAGCFRKLIEAQGQEWDPCLLQQVFPRSPLRIVNRYPPSFRMTETHLWATGKKNASCHRPDANKEDAFGWTPLQYAAASRATGSLDRLRKLLMIGADPDARNMLGWTALHYACEQGEAPMARELLARGAVVDIVGNDGVSAMHQAAKNGNADLMGELLARSSGPPQGGTLAGQDCHRRAPIHWAAMEGHIEVVRLLAGGLDLVDRYGWNPLHLAVIYRHQGLARCLMEELNARVDVVDNKKRTLLHLATMASRNKGPGEQRSIIQMLLERGAKVNVQDDEAMTPLHFAAQNRDVEIVRMLVERDREGCREAASTFTLHGDLLLHYLARMDGSGDMIREVLQMMPEIDVNAPSTVEHTPLHIATGEGRAGAVRALLEGGAWRNVENCLKKTPFDIAKTNCDGVIIRLLGSEKCQGCDQDIDI
ncbi:hypothetical protein ACJ41O_011025 [Fusarium nematophilum]